MVAITEDKAPVVKENDMTPMSMRHTQNHFSFEEMGDISP
jgi:hypothetical protein